MENSFEIPNGVTEIGRYAFYACTSLTNITIPDSVTEIGEFAFSGCKSLKYNEYDNAYYLGNDTDPYVVLVKAKDTTISSCNINQSTKIIYNFAFSGCSSLTSITIPDGVTEIGQSAFSGCINLTSVIIGNGVTIIKYGAFSNCYSLENITIPKNVIQMEPGVFRECSSLTVIYCCVKSQPDGWINWNIGCKATVVWGYKV